MQIMRQKGTLPIMNIIVGIYRPPGVVSAPIVAEFF